MKKSKTRQRFEECGHKGQGPERYVAWHDWAEEQDKKGIKQTLCKKCGLWVWPPAHQSGAEEKDE